MKHSNTQNNPQFGEFNSLMRSGLARFLVEEEFGAAGYSETDLEQITEAIENAIPTVLKFPYAQVTIVIVAWAGDYVDLNNLEIFELNEYMGSFKRLYSLDIQVLIGLKITKDTAGMLTCFCGNDASYEGLYPCDLKGNEIEPDENWTPELYFCDRCGRIIDYQTTRVVGFRKENTLTEDERKHIVAGVKRYGLPKIKK